MRANSSTFWHTWGNFDDYLHAIVNITIAERLEMEDEPAATLKSEIIIDSPLQLSHAWPVNIGTVDKVIRADSWILGFKSVTIGD
jgi:hypothetical protein